MEAAGVVFDNLFLSELNWKPSVFKRFTWDDPFWDQYQHIPLPEWMQRVVEENK